MTRSGYSEDFDDNWPLICWRGAVKSAIRGTRGQAFLREMLAALDAMPEKRLIADDLIQQSGEVCAIGAVGVARGLNMDGINPEERDTVAKLFGIAPALAAEVVWMNDEFVWSGWETPEARFARMHQWIQSQIREPSP